MPVEIKRNQVYNIDCREGAKELKKINIKADAIVTSPPYYKQRKYPAKNVIWDGDENYEHEFDKDNFCKKCNAWLGQLGQEPHLKDRVIEVEMMELREDLTEIELEEVLEYFKDLM